MKKEDKTYYEILNKAYFESSAQFDKQILFISSGALGLSFTFIKDIVELETAICKGLLLVSWILFSIVILMSLFSHYTSKQAINTQIENIEDEKNNKANFLNSITKLLNISMIISIVLGLISLILFIIINII